MRKTSIGWNPRDQPDTVGAQRVAGQHQHVDAPRAEGERPQRGPVGEVELVAALESRQRCARAKVGRSDAVNGTASPSSRTSGTPSSAK